MCIDKETKKTDDKNIKGDDNMTPTLERYCTIENSIKESAKEVKLMRDGKLPKRNWRDSFAKLKDDAGEE